MYRGVVVGLMMIVGAVHPAAALRLPLRAYGSAEGLTDAGVNRVRIGPDDFVWVATRGGLWRFDGERFDRLGPADGVPRAEVFDFAFTEDDSLWIASEVGLYHGDPSRVVPGQPAFTQIALGEGAGRERPFRVAPAPDGALWVGTLGGGGLWRVATESSGILARRHPLASGDPARPLSRVQALAVDAAGSVWVGTHAFGIYCVRASGKIEHVSGDIAGADFVRDFLFDQEGGVWTAFLGGVARFDGASFHTGALPDVVLGSRDGLPGIDTQELLALAADHLLLASTAGITEIDRGPDRRWHVGETLDRRWGLPGDNVGALVRDPVGNLWMGFALGGLAKQIAGGFTRVEAAEEPGARIAALGLDRQGHLAVLSRAGAVSATVRVIRGDLAQTHTLALPQTQTYTGWGLQQILAQDPAGTWWIAAGAGVLRFSGPGEDTRRLERPPDAIVGVERGLPSTDTYLVFLDSSGDLWTSTASPRAGLSSVGHIHPTSLSVETFTPTQIGSPGVAVGFAEDGARNLWIAFDDGTLVRRSNGRFLRLAPSIGRLDAAPFVRDGHGRLWVLGESLATVEDATTDHPSVRRHEVPASLGELSFMSGVDDGTGTLYLGTPRGVLRLDPDSNRARLFTAEDGLVPGIIRLVARDADGVLWFSDESGLSRLTPRPDPPPTQHAPRIRAVRVAGIPIPVPAVGAATVGPVTVAPSQRSVEIDYFTIHLGPGESPSFQHQLLGVDRDWSQPTRERSVLYAGLAPGHHHFAVRTLEADGLTFSEPAVVEFDVLAPFWRRGWFVALLVAAAAMVGYGAHRSRVARVLAIERVRTRIATDLHDEIGSSLSQISVLSQVAERDVARAAGAPPPALSRITELARSVVEAMGETVWAISPREDHLSDLVHRMRRFGLDLFADQTAEVRLALPPDAADERLDVDVRRTIYLVFKEALHNVKKHAGASKIDVRLARRRGGYELRVHDDGRGFDPATPALGHGLESMRRRAQSVGGTIEVRSQPGSGADLVLQVPTSRRPLSERIVGRPGRKD